MGSQRDLKFRIWDKDTLENLTSYCSILAENGNIVCIHKKYNKLSSEECKDQFIVEQFTGLLDKSEVEIYEGDIVLSQSNNTFDIKQSRYKVVFQCGMFCAGAWPQPLWSMGGTQIKNQPCIANRLEVIGTIHTHPDLLETK